MDVAEDVSDAWQAESLAKSVVLSFRRLGRWRIRIRRSVSYLPQITHTSAHVVAVTPVLLKRITFDVNSADCVTWKQAVVLKPTHPKWPVTFKKNRPSR